MTQKSLNNPSPFRVRFTERLSSSKMTLTVLTVINLFGLPVFTGGMMQMTNGMPYSYSRELILTVVLLTGALLTVASAAAGAVCGVKSFHYCLNRQEADTVLSLPAERKTLFMADWLSGLVLCAGPALISSAVTVLVILTGRNAPCTYIFDSLCPGLEAAFMILSFLTAVIICYCSSVLCTVHSSSAASAVLNILLLNAALYAAVFISGSCIIQNSFGINGGTIYQYIALLSPVGILQAGRYYSLMLHPFITVLVNLAAAALTVFFSRRVYLKKPPEKITGKFTGPGVYCIIIFSAAVSFIIGMSMQRVYHVFVIAVIAAAAFIAAELLRKKKSGRKSFSIICPAVSLAAAFAFSLSLPALTKSTGTFGAERWVPESSEIAATEIRGDIPGTFHRYISMDNSKTPETAELVQKLQTSILESRTDTLPLECIYEAYYISYYMKDGRVIEREYYDLTRSEETRKTAAEIGASDYVKDLIFDELKRTFEGHTNTFTDPDYRYDKLMQTKYYVNFRTDLLPAQAEEFYGILHDDIYSATEEELMNAGESSLNFNESWNFPACYENTIDYIHENFFVHDFRR